MFPLGRLWIPGKCNEPCKCGYCIALLGLTSRFGSFRHCATAATPLTGIKRWEAVAPTGFLMFSAQLSNKLEASANHELTCQALILPQAQEEWRMEQITWQILANSEQAMFFFKTASQSMLNKLFAICLISDMLQWFLQYWRIKPKFWDLVGSPEENKVCLNGEAQGTRVGQSHLRKTGPRE